MSLQTNHLAHPTSSGQGLLLSVGSPLYLNLSRKPSVSPGKSPKTGKKQDSGGGGERQQGRALGGLELISACFLFNNKILEGSQTKLFEP